MNTSGQLSHTTGNVRSAGGHMVKMTNQKALLLTLAVFTVGISSTFVGLAFADDQDSKYSHQHITASWDHGIVCGDHKCSPGETPQNPPVVVPVKGVH